MYSTAKQSEVIKMKKPELLVLENPGEFDSLDDRTAELFEEVDRKTLPLLDKIIKPFEEMNKERTGLHNNDRPQGVKTNQYAYGDVVVSVKTTPTTLKTNYKIVVEEVENFLEFIKNDYAEGRLRKGVLTIDGRAYISLSEVVSQIEGLKAQALEGKDGVRQEVSFVAPERLAAEGIEKVVYRLGKDYAKPTAENAADFARATSLKTAINEGFYKRFIEALNQSTGYSDENLPETTVQEFVRAGNYLFPIQIIPKDSPKYGKIIDVFIKPYKKNITKSTGELIRLQEGTLDEELARYAPRMRDGEQYILLDTLIGRFDEARAEYTSRECTYKRDRSFRI
jgi:hypothetical protein